MISLLRDLSLRAKITISFVLIVICGTTVSTFLGSKIVTAAMLDEGRKQIRHGLIAADLVYSERLESVKKSIEGAAATEQLATALGTNRKDGTLPRVLTEIRNKNRLDFLTFASSDRREITRPFGTQVRADSSEGIPYAFPDFFSNAIAGKATAGTELIGERTLEQEAPDLVERTKMTPPDGSGGPSSQGMVLIAAAPVNTSNGIAGVLFGGVLLNRNDALINQINEFVFGSKAEGAAGIVTIFNKNIRIATNVVDGSGKLLVGGQAPVDIYREVIADGKAYDTRSFVSGSWHLTAGEPIRDHRNRIIGILGVGIPENPFLEVRTSMMMTFLLVAGGGILVVLALTYFITRSMIHPLEEMVKASNRIAAGDLDHSVHINSQDEIGILANSFNKMLASIKTMKLELEEWGRTLEEKVNKRTEELVAVQTQMAQSEKLASIGRLAAGVAHEINNPLGGILTFSMLALEDCDDDHPLKESLEVIVKQTLRCRETVKGLLDFARQSSSTPSLTEVNQIVDKTLLLLENQTIFQNIKTIRRFAPDLPNVLIDAGQLQQVVINIVINAVDAMDEKGTLTVETSRSRNTPEIMLRISDTGKGIPEDILPLIFEPFFTTKKVGKGTGLGLSIVHGIVTRAGGKIEVTSSSKGATFIIKLPIAQEGKRIEQPQAKDTPGGAGKSAQRG